MGVIGGCVPCNTTVWVSSLGLRDIALCGKEPQIIYGDLVIYQKLLTEIMVLRDTVADFCLDGIGVSMEICFVYCTVAQKHSIPRAARRYSGSVHGYCGMGGFLALRHTLSKHGVHFTASPLAKLAHAFKKAIADTPSPT